MCVCVMSVVMCVVMCVGVMGRLLPNQRKEGRLKWGFPYLGKKIHQLNNELVSQKKKGTHHKIKLNPNCVGKKKIARKRKD